MIELINTNYLKSISHSHDVGNCIRLDQKKYDDELLFIYKNILK